MNASALETRLKVNSVVEHSQKFNAPELSRMAVKFTF